MAVCIHTNTVEGYYSIFKRGMKGFISAAPKSICTAISRNLTSATATTCDLVLTIKNVRVAPCRGSLGNA
jgi:hypothetical protein